ncbi:MAG TPA: NAD(P)-binding domain-containing protein, partial [Reyranella sp.]|nr:NAD(P)-binding domain-containing protein [Reyranella sp.]
MNSITLGIVGYGEVGKTFAKGLQGKDGIAGICAWDLNFQAPARAEAERAHADSHGVLPAPGMAALCERATIIMSAVTASNTLAVAEEAARHLRTGTVFLDLNSASPGTKQQAARVIDGAGGRYVEAGVMTSVPPYGIAV